MSDERIIVHRSGRVVRQKFYVTIVAANGETLFTSEMFRDKDHAIELGQRFAAKLDGNFINAT